MSHRKPGPFATGGIVSDHSHDDDLVPALLSHGGCFIEVQAASPGDYECYHCQRGQCARCNDPDCTCCYGNED
jgi:hypothetical protein